MRALLRLAPFRLAAYGLLLVALFGGAVVVADAVTPERTTAAPAPVGHGDTHPPETSGPETSGPGTAEPGEQHGDHGSAEPAGPTADGLARAQDGYRLASVEAPDAVGEDGVLGLTVLGPDGRPLTGYTPSHEKELHLVVVRLDGAGFRHVHPTRDAAGRWTIPWRWDAAGSYRLYADFVPTGREGGLTLSTVVPVAGELVPRVVSGPVRSAEVDGYRVDLTGDLRTGEGSTLTATVSRDGAPVTSLEPYLGAFGHLVALREGDLAYLHVHPHGATPAPGDRSGPEVAFEATAPTPGRYLLYLDLKVEGRVRTTAFVLDAAEPTAPAGPTPSAEPTASEEPDHAEHPEEDGHEHDGQ